MIGIKQGKMAGFVCAAASCYYFRVTFFRSVLEITNSGSKLVQKAIIATITNATMSSRKNIAGAELFLDTLSNANT